MLEKDITAAITRYLKTVPCCFFWKEHGGQYGTAGLPDLILCYRGRFVAFVASSRRDCTCSSFELMRWSIRYAWDKKSLAGMASGLLPGHFPLVILVGDILLLIMGLGGNNAPGAFAFGLCLGCSFEECATSAVRFCGFERDTFAATVGKAIF